MLMVMKNSDCNGNLVIFFPKYLTPSLDQTGWMPRLIWVFAGCTCHFVGFVMRRLKCLYGSRMISLFLLQIKEVSTPSLSFKELWGFLHWVRIIIQCIISINNFNNIGLCQTSSIQNVHINVGILIGDHIKMIYHGLHMNDINNPVQTTVYHKLYLKSLKTQHLVHFFQKTKYFQ